MPLSTPAVIDLDMDDVDGDIERAAWSLLYGSMPSVHLRSTTCDRHTVNVDRLTTHLESLSWADPLPIVCSLLLSSPVPSLFSSLCALVQSSPTVCVPPSLPFLCALAARVCPRPACVCALPCSSPLTHNVCDPDLTPLLNTVYEQLSSVLTSGGVDALAGPCVCVERYCVCVYMCVCE